MSENVTTIQKKRRTRSPSVAKPAFVVVQVLDENGEPVSFDKKRLKIVAVERSAEKVMEMMEDGQVPNALYLRVIVPVARVQAPRHAKDQAA
jgi:hypothetical protein